MPSQTPIPPPRTPFLDPRTGMISREWYQFFMHLDGSSAGENIAGDKGDITVSGGVWTIDNGVVTYPKIQNVSADSLLGRTGTTGIVEEIPAGQAARNLLAADTPAEERAVLELGSAAVEPASSFAPWYEGVTNGNDHDHDGGDGAVVKAFPVGSVFIAVVATDPSILLGYGEWSPIGQGQIVIGGPA